MLTAKVKLPSPPLNRVDVPHCTTRSAQMPSEQVLLVGQTIPQAPQEVTSLVRFCGGSRVQDSNKDGSMAL